MMGVLGAEFGQEMEPAKRKDKDDKKKQQAVKGFSSTDYSHARHTSEYIFIVCCSEVIFLLSCIKW